MKKNMFLILVGVASLHVVIFSGLFASSGCRNVVMDERRYVPSDNAAVEPMAETPQTGVPPAAAYRPAEPQQNVRPEPRPAAKETFAPMEPVTVKPAAASPAEGGTYVVKAGDTIGKIAHANGVSMAAMLQANNLDLQSARKIRVGQKLVIPAGAAASAKPAGEKPAASKPVASKPAASPAGEASAAVVAADGTYVVKAGDNIPKIARKLGVKAADLQKANNLSDEATRRLQIGQRLVVPGKGAPISAAAENTAGRKTETPAASVPAVKDEPKSAGNDDLSVDLSAALNAAAEAKTPEASAPVPSSDFVIGNSTPVEVTEAVSLEAFAAANKTSVEALKKLNGGDLPADGNLQPGMILFIPAAE